MSYEKPKIISVKIADILSRLGPAHASMYIVDPPGGPGNPDDENSD